MAETSAKLTKRTVDSAAQKAERYTLWDTELKGFALRVAESGTKTYILRYRPRGTGRVGPRRFMVLGRHGAITPDEARAHAKAILGAVAAGQDPAKERSQANSAMPIAELVELFINEHAKPKRKPRTAADYTAALRSYLVPKFGKRAADQVTAAEISQLHLSLRDRPYQANRLVAIIASLYGFAARRGIVPRGANPAQGIERFREFSRERYLGVEELNRLGETLRLAESVGLPWRSDGDKPKSKHLVREESRRTVISPEVILAFRLLMFTGARLQEILTLEWSHIDFERGLMNLPDSKTGRKTIVMSAAAVDLLRYHERRGAFVIPGADVGRSRSGLKKPWRAIQRHAGLEGVRIHDLRHTFASIGAGASLGLPIVGKLLGHSQPATTARYAHLDADPLRRASNIIGDHLTAALAGRNAGTKS
ncbi:MAG: tyrosine-type recombinase/integrase [Roseiarcus sp.]